MNFEQILKDAYEAARNAAVLENGRLSPEGSRGLDCGFAWVDISTSRDTDWATKEFVKFCRKNGKNEQSSYRSHYGAKRGYGAPAWQFWSPAKASTQSVSVHYAGAVAFAKVLQENGISAYANERLD